MAPLPKRTRIGKSKTRTGCKNCNLKTPALTSLTPRISSPQRQHFSARETRSLQYFLLNSASSISGSFRPDFWKVQLPQAAASHSTIRHAIVAVASLHEVTISACSEALGLSVVDAVEQAATHRFAIQQYGIVIQAARRLMLKTEKAEAMETILLRCVLFVCFEFLQSRFNVAAVNLQNGLQIMREWHLGKEKAAPSSFHDSLVRIFDRLSIISFSMDEPLSCMCSGSVSAPPESTDKDVPFSSIQEAQHQLDRLLLESFPKMKACEELGINPSDPQREEMATYLRTFRTQLSSWSTKFATFLSTHASTLTPLNRSASHVLHRTQLATLIWASAALSPAETAYDAHFSTFVAILDHVEAQLAEERENGEILHDFILETGFLAYTYFVARKCRDRKLRRKALGILVRASPRQEGVCKAGMLASVAGSIVDMEEGMGEFEEGDEGEGRNELPSEEKRVVDTCGVAGDNVWVQDWKNGRGGIVEHELLLREEKVTFVLRPQG